MIDTSNPPKKRAVIIVAILVSIAAAGMLFRSFFTSPPSRDELGLSNLSMTDENGDKWALDLAKGQSVSSIKGSDNRPGPPLLIKTDVQIKRREVSIGLVVEGQAGEKYAGGAKKNGRWLPPPSFKIFDEAGKPVPTLEHVVDRLGDRGRTRQARVLLTQPRFQSSQKGRALFLAHAQTLFGAQAVDVALDVEQYVNALDRR